MHWNAVGTDNPIVSQSIDYFNSKNEALVVMLSPQYFQKSRTAILLVALLSLRHWTEDASVNC